MNNTFQINIVYSNLPLCDKRGKTFKHYMSFNTELYKNNPECCPWPKAKKLYENLIKKYEKGMIDYFVPFKRTNHYIFIKSAAGYIEKKKIKVDENGIEYIKFEGVEVFADDCVNDKLKEIRKNTEMQRQYDQRYIGYLRHLEEHGYVYLSNLEKITSIDALNEVYDKVSIFDEYE